MRDYFVYMVRCHDGSYYTGITNDVPRRLNEHNGHQFPQSYCHKRRPVELVYSAWFQYVDEAIAWEKRVKRWTRKKKEALIQGEFDQLVEYAKSQYVRRIDGICNLSRHSIVTLSSSKGDNAA
jgi:putative endonuclease